MSIANAAVLMDEWYVGLKCSLVVIVISMTIHRLKELSAISQEMSIVLLNENLKL
jgi:hypothetical protein